MAKKVGKAGGKSGGKAGGKSGGKPGPGRRSAAGARAVSEPSRKGSPLKDFCRSLPGTTEDVKWGDDHVFSVGGKMYAAFDIDGEARFGFKCDDEDFDELTERDGIIPAPYAARFGWVSIRRRGALKGAEAKRLIRKSYDLVFSKLPKRVQREVAGS